MSDAAEMAQDLRAHLGLCEELLLMVERENQALRTSADSPAAEFAQLRKRLLPRLDGSLTRLRKHRMSWQRLDPAVRKQNPEVASLLRLNQDLIMKIIFLGRENEETLLRRGLLPPGQLPPPESQRPNFVSELYRRHSRS
jgi:hypothetical protein